MASSAGLRTRTKNSACSSVSSVHPSTNHLVVCGAVGVDDVWLFGDFLGFTSLLKEQSVYGTFINCFDLDSYFKHTEYPDIKFGRRWEIPDDENRVSGDEIVVYTKFDWQHRTRWWTQLEKPEVDRARSLVLEWIADRAKTTKAGDIVTIVLIGHGNTEGIGLGGRLLEPMALANACSHLPADAQLNIVIKSCYSGVFTKAFETSQRSRQYIHTSANAEQESFSALGSIRERFGNSVFGSAFVRALGLMKEPEETWRLIKHGEFIKTQCENPTYSRRLSTPQISTTSKKTELMNSILFRDYVDVSIPNPPQRARRVITPPSISHSLPSSGLELTMNSAPYRAATAFIAKEMDMANTDMPDPSDMALVESWFIPWSSPSLKAQNIQKILHGLAFRWLAQERILMIAEDLISQGLVNIESFNKPMALASNQDYSDSAKTVYKVLLSFTLGSDCLDRFHVPGNHDPGRPFMSALRWLFVLVCRSCTDWELVVSRWVGFQLPGKPICSDSDLLPRKHTDASTPTPTRPSSRQQQTNRIPSRSWDSGSRMGSRSKNLLGPG